MRSFISILILSVTMLANPFADAHAQSMLWRIDIQGVESPSWIFGTMHARCAQDIKLSDALLDALKTSEQLALELDLDDPALAMGIAKHAFVPKDSSLRNLLSTGAYDTLSAYLRDSVSMQIPNVESLRPLFLVGLLMGKALGCTPVAYEDRLMDVAKANEKEVIGIETVEEQFAAFNTIPLREQARMVLEMIQGMDKIREEFLRLDAAYTRGDIGALLTLVKESDLEYGRYDDALLSDRNHRWIPRILTTARQRSTFFAVGAGHLAGAEGVLSLLRDEGCKVEAVVQTPEPGMR